MQGPNNLLSMAERELVTIGSESFSLVEVPSSATDLVRKRKEILLGTVDLAALVSDLGKVGDFVRIAYNGVAGYTKHQIMVRKLGYNVTQLCDKTAVTVTKFKQASDSVLSDLQATYQFLFDGLEDVALVTLSAVADVAKELAAAAEQLHEDFEQASKDTEKVLEEVSTKKGEEEDRKKKLEVEAEDMETERVVAEAKKKEAEEQYKFYEKQYEVAAAKQAEEEANATGFFKSLTNAVVRTATLGVVDKAFDTEQNEEYARNAREEKLKHLEEMKRQRAERSKAYQDIAAFTTKIKQCRGDSAELAKVVIPALHEAIGGLHRLSVVMLSIAMFWKQMQIHCEQLAKGKMQKMITSVMEKPEATRLRVWTSPAFKKQAVEYYAQWVALDEVCSTYLQRIQTTRAGLYQYLRENPTISEARENVHVLADKLEQDLKNAWKEMADKNEADQKEKEALENGTPAP